MIGMSVSLDCLKKANQAVKLSCLEHYVSFNYIFPFLQLLESLNPGLKFKLERDESTFQFKRVAILFPYSVCAIDYCFQVYGVDAAFIDGLEIKGKERRLLRQFVPNLLQTTARIMFQKNFLCAISGRTLNNEMIIFAICIGYSECTDDYNFLFQFVKDNGVNNIMTMFKCTIFIY